MSRLRPGRGGPRSGALTPTRRAPFRQAAFPCCPPAPDGGGAVEGLTARAAPRARLRGLMPGVTRAWRAGSLAPGDLAAVLGYGSTACVTCSGSRLRLALAALSPAVRVCQ